MIFQKETIMPSVPRFIGILCLIVLVPLVFLVLVNVALSFTTY